MLRIQKILTAFLVWLVEGAVGTLPLVAHFAVRRLLIPTYHLAICEGAEIAKASCLWMPDEPYREIAIITMVTAIGALAGELKMIRLLQARLHLPHYSSC